MIHIELPQLAPVREPVDSLFADLDQQSISDSNGGWTTEVIGIHRSDREVWVQIGNSDAGDETILMHLSPWASAEDALSALQKWSNREPSVRPRVIEVMRHM